MPKTNHWHPVMLPDDYLRKLKRDLVEAEEVAECETRLEADLDDPPPSDDAPPP